jgi:hypothetical protein
MFGCWRLPLFHQAERGAIHAASSSTSTPTPARVSPLSPVTPRAPEQSQGSKPEHEGGLKFESAVVGSVHDRVKGIGKVLEKKAEVGGSTGRVYCAERTAACWGRMGGDGKGVGWSTCGSSEQAVD